MNKAFAQVDLAHCRARRLPPRPSTFPSTRFVGKSESPILLHRNRCVAPILDREQFVHRVRQVHEAAEVIQANSPSVTLAEFIRQNNLPFASRTTSAGFPSRSQGMTPFVGREHRDRRCSWTVGATRASARARSR